MTPDRTLTSTNHTAMNHNRRSPIAFLRAVSSSHLAVCRVLGVGVLSFGALGCGPKAPAEGAPEAVAEEKPPELHQMLPLKDQTVSNFRMTTDLGDEGILVLEIYRPRPELAELRIAGRAQRLAIEDNRISQTTGGILLETPLKKGHAFIGSFGTVTISETGQLVTVPAGTYSGCLTTVEESTRPPKRSTSTYCPGIGLVLMEVESFGESAGLVRTELSYHGPRVEFPKRHERK